MSALAILALCFGLICVLAPLAQQPRLIVAGRHFVSWATALRDIFAVAA